MVWPVQRLFVDTAVRFFSFFSFCCLFGLQKENENSFVLSRDEKGTQKKENDFILLLVFCGAFFALAAVVLRRVFFLVTK